MIRSGALEGVHGVIVDAPGKSAGTEWLPSEREAEQAFDRILDELRTRNGPCIFRVRRVEGVVERAREYVVCRPPTYG